MTMTRSPALFVVKNGRLVPKEQENVHMDLKQAKVQYQRTVTPSPDQYHTEAIKQYRSEISELRHKYNQLLKLYLNLIGYEGEISDHEYAKFGSNYTDSKEYEKLTSSVATTSKTNHSLKSSQILKQASHPQLQRQSKQVLTTFSTQNGKMPTITSFNIASFSQNMSTLANCQNNQQNALEIIKANQNHKNQRIIRNKTEMNDEDSMDLFECQLRSAIKEIEVLRRQINILNQRKIKENDFKEMNRRIEELIWEIEEERRKRAEDCEKLREYEMCIRKLEEILERERRNSRMLNEVISRMRLQIQVKDQIINKSASNC